MPYTLTFSDPANLKTLSVPDYPPGLNAVDTSLSFIGKSYPNYGQVIDQNFLKLLENFAAPLEPNSPIKGQLWYDSYSKSLKLFDGNVWKSANGIYQQTTDPSISSPVSYGDIWVDTSANLLKIRAAGSWIQVGPSISEGTGFEVVTLNDSANPAEERIVLFLKVNNQVVAVFNNGTDFIPTTMPSSAQGFVEGFAKGITLPDYSSTEFKIRGTVDNSLKLNSVAGSKYLRKDDTSVGGQLITGKVVFETPNTGGQENRDGIIIRTSGDNAARNFIQFFKKTNDAVISNQVRGGKVIVKIKGPNDINQSDVLTVEKGQTTLVGNLVISNGVISANTFTGTLNTAAQPKITSVGTLTSLSVSGNISVSASVSAGNITSTGTIVTDFIYATAGIIGGINNTGTVQLWVGSTSTVPNGWLVCNGTQVSTTTYAALYQVLGNRYGIATSTFYLPNMVMTTPLPAGDPRGASTATYYIIRSTQS